MISLGSFPGWSFDAYAAVPAVSNSMLKRFAKAAAKARFGGWKETPALEMGSLVHTAVLEPWSLEDRYAATDLDRRGTKAWAEEEARANNRSLVKRADFEAALAMRDAVMAHPTAGALIAPEMVVEQSIFWRDEATGLMRKARPDGLRRDLRVAVDVKTCVDASAVEFGWAAHKFGYDWQAAGYCDGIEIAEGWRPDAFIFVAVEKEAPHLVATYEILPDDITRAAGKVADALMRWAECEKAEAAGADPRAAWPGYPNNLMPLSLPARAYE